MIVSFRRKLSITLLFSFIGLASFAQLTSKLELGAGIGTLIYQGDLSNSKWGSRYNLKPSFTGFGVYNINSMFSVRANLVLGSISGDDSHYPYPPYRQHRNLSFSTPITEFSALVEWYPLKGGNQSEHRLIPYVFVGAGLSFVNIDRNWSRFDTAYFAGTPAISGLAADTMHKLPHSIKVLPVGAGLRFAITPQWSVFGEAMYRFTFFDYLDGFKYVANPNSNDAYYGITIGVRYRLIKDGSVACPSTSKIRHSGADTP